jgi:hypothetical protein
LAAQIHPLDSDGLPRGASAEAAPYVFQQNSDLTNFFRITRLFYNGHVIFIGHANQGGFGWGADTLITEGIGYNQILQEYGNTVNMGAGTYSYAIRKRYVEIDGCKSSGQLNWAFGTPDRNLDADPGLEPSTYCGWTTLIYPSGYWPFPNTPYENHVMSLQGMWAYFGFDDGPGIQDASDLAFQYYGDEDLIPTFKIVGSRSLRWIRY